MKLVQVIGVAAILGLGFATSAFADNNAMAPAAGQQQELQNQKSGSDEKIGGKAEHHKYHHRHHHRHHQNVNGMPATGAGYHHRYHHHHYHHQHHGWHHPTSMDRDIMGDHS